MLDPMLRPLPLPLALCLALPSLAAPSAGPGLAAFYDSLDVEHHWLKGWHIDWRTGDPDNGKPGRTHCSAFAAAACERLGIQLLRPPEHGQKNLANAQHEWLAGPGSAFGWRMVASPFEAQSLANGGQVVTVVFRNPNPRKSGHIALVRPSDKPEALIRAEGPQIIQAGGTNRASTSVKVGFRHHTGAWVDADRFTVRFFAHPSPRIPAQ